MIDLEEKSPLEISDEEYALLDVRPVRPPRTPDFNVQDLMDRAEGETKEDKRRWLNSVLSQFSQVELAALRHKWSFWARNNQLAPPGDWTIWLLLAGRGFGKTRTGAEWINERVQAGVAKRIALVAPTAADVRKVMVEGESGILAISPPWNRPLFEPSKLQLTWPNGAIAQLFSAEEPERLRGPQCDTFWADELAAWKKLQETWDMLQFGFRLGDDPRGCVTTTPKPLQLVKEMVSDDVAILPEFRKPGWTGETIVTRGSTYDNKANLAPKFFAKTVKKYEGTRLGKQELEAAILEDMPGALWMRSWLDASRIRGPAPFPPILKASDVVPGSESKVEDLELLRRAAAAILASIPEDLSRVIVAVDPNASNNEGSDEIGIVVAAKGMSGRGYVLADASMKGSPSEWATVAILAHDLFKADRIIGEANQGGNMVEHTIAATAKFLRMESLRASDHVAITLVHATRGKVTRAEPVAALYAQRRWTHVGTMNVLEDQMCLFTADFDRKSMGYSPDRVDALVWAGTHLFLEASDTGILEFYGDQFAQKQARIAAATSPANYVRMEVPSGVNTAYGREGDKYEIVEGVVSVRPDDVSGFRQAGFTEIV